MPKISTLRKDPYFAKMFAFVHPLCWFVLVWQLDRFFRWTRKHGITNALYSVNRWGFLSVVFFGEKDDPAAYKPLARIFRPLTDASYASDVPANLDAVPFLPRKAGEVAQKAPEGALPALPNTS